MRNLQESETQMHQLYYGDSWFASVTCVAELWKHFNVHFLGVIKMNHARFPKQFIESSMKDWPAGSHIVLEGLTDDGIKCFQLATNTIPRRSCILFLQKMLV